MNDRLAKRQPIDLEELDRQLRTAAPILTAEREDPLAELARLVNSSPDPFAPIFAKGGEGAAAAQRPSQAAPAPQLRPSFDDSGPWQPREAEAQTYREEPGFAAYEPAAKPRREGRHRVTLISLAVASALAAVVGTLALRGHVGRFGAPPTIMADATPYKVPGAGQNKATAKSVRSADSVTSAHIVNNVEQPVDLSLAGSNQDQTGSQSSTSSSSFFPPPRSVQSVSVRPDGSVIGSDGGQAGDGSAAVSPDGQQPSNSAPGAADGGASAAMPTAPSTVAPAASGLAAASQPPISTPSAPARQTPGQSASFANLVDQAASDTRAAQTPARTPKPVRTTTPARSTAPVRSASLTPASTPSANATAPGNSVAGATWSVQLAAPASEKEAAAASARLAHKYAAELSGHGLVSRQAELNGRRVWRVRVADLSRQDAIDICTRIKGSGGACFLARE